MGSRGEKAAAAIQHKHGLTPRLLKERKKGNRVGRRESVGSLSLPPGGSSVVMVKFGASIHSWLGLTVPALELRNVFVPHILSSTR